MSADLIKNLVARRFKKEGKAVFFELGLCRRGRYRADVFALAMNGHITVVEVKASVQDAIRDRKMHEYLRFSNKFYLACTESVFDQIEVKLYGAGVFVIADDYSGIVKVKPAKNRDIKKEATFNLAVRAAFRNSDLCDRKNKKV